MDALVDVIVAVAAFLLELLWWACVGLYIGARAIFSERHREKLRHEWCSGWKGKLVIVFSVLFWTVIAGIAAYVWVPVLIRTLQS